ncbi:MAG TPA: response regulator [Candidatus Dormibacteraeota bacterium]|nr:response regulator [Candidatus Dormibacteraeota bacterium]
MAPQPRVLVVEDDASLRRVIELRLRIDGFAVSSAEDGQAGLEVLDAARPEVVVCDLMMPRLDGFGFCRQARLRAGFEHLPIVLLTAHERDEEIDDLLTLGGITYMAKPFESKALAATLHAMIDGHVGVGRRA